MLVNEVLTVISLHQLLVSLDELADDGPVPAPAPPDRMSLARRELKSIPDTVLLRRLVPSELYERMWGAGYLGMHALSFALRSRIAYVALLSHLASADDGGAELEELALPGDADREADLRTIADFPWRRGDRLPIIGFSASGSYVLPNARGSCRAFDAYDLPSCGAVAPAGLFCADHLAEAWWRRHPGPCSTQATMCAFYSDRDGFAQYDEATLSGMVREVLRKLRALQFTPDEVDQALLRLGFVHRDELLRLGSSELRRRFLQAAHRAHPDKGGEASDFVALRQSYEVLRGVLLAHAASSP